MQTVLIDKNKKWCKANLHCHTTNSDGHFSPLEIKKMYKEKGYEVVAFSDHEVIFDSSYLTDKDFVALTATEYSFGGMNRPANSTYCDPNKFPLPRDIKTIHINFFAKDPHNTFHFATNMERIDKRQLDLVGKDNFRCDGYNRILTQESVQETIDRGIKAGFLAQFNHPNWSLNTREDYINLKNLWSLEILNYGTEQETSAEYCINIYDDMIREGHKICCTMGDDNHNYEGKLDDSFGGYNYIGVDKLTYDEVIHAMEMGNIYASNGPIIKSLFIDHNIDKIFVECSEATDIILTGYNRTFRHYHGEDLTSADFKIFGGEVYFRITIKDKYGKVAHTRVYFLEDYGYKLEK